MLQGFRFKLCVSIQLNDIAEQESGRTVEPLSRGMVNMGDPLKDGVNSKTYMSIS